jgi:hypothetical protein
MEIIIAAIVAVVGWVLVVSGWIITDILTIRAQNKNFKNQIINNARLDLTKAIADYQDWLGGASNAVCGVNVAIALQERGIPADCVQNWLQKHTELSALFFSDRRSDEWMFRLIEHRILFPKTYGCMDELADRQRRITKHLSSFLDELPSGLEKRPDLENRKKAMEKVQNSCIDSLTSQGALMWDLRNYLQNLCLSTLTGNKVPMREAGKSPEVLVEDERGNLRVVTAEATTKEEEES